LSLDEGSAQHFCFEATLGVVDDGAYFDGACVGVDEVAGGNDLGGE
jgi:hypothetical protein